MTPPIGFRIDPTNDPQSSLMEIRPAAAIADATGTVMASSSIADYAYRIAALTVGLAFLATVV